MFQSTPAHQDGRNLVVPNRMPVPACFNPLPLTRTGETEGIGVGAPCLTFQSTPAHQDGRNHLIRVLQQALDPVSIHSRSPGREKPFRSPAAPGSTSFNPLPLTRTGETAPPTTTDPEAGVSIHSRSPGREKLSSTGGAGNALPVSIHSRSPGREKPRCETPRKPTCKSFNPLPLTRTGETYWEQQLAKWHSEFQSTPAHQDGRNCPGAPPRSASTGFNPLPLTRTGETRQADRGPPDRAGFNPLPLTRTGETRQPRWTRRGSTRFQSTPAHQDGRNPRRDYKNASALVSIHSRSPGREKRAVRHDLTLV